jgi:hypothetical protein
MVVKCDFELSTFLVLVSFHVSYDLASYISIPRRSYDLNNAP